MQQHSSTIKLDREQRKRERSAAKLARKRARQEEVKPDGSGTEPRSDPVAPAERR
jgi:hypothetical protein